MMIVSEINTGLAQVPDNVPHELVRDVDIYNLMQPGEDPHQAWKRIQTDMPEIFWTPRNGGLWMITRARDIVAMQVDWEHFSTRGLLVPRIPRPFVAPPLDFDGEEHAAYRLLISPAFSPKVIANLEDHLRVDVIKIVEELKPKGQCEFVKDFAKRLPITVLLRMLDLPQEDGLGIMEKADVLVTTNDEKQVAAARMALVNYVTEKVQERIDNPRDDFISRLLAGKVDGETVPVERVIAMLVLTLGGGLDTVKNMMSYVCRFLAMHPEHRRQLVEDPSLIPHALEEIIRRHGIPNTGRLVVQDYDFKGVHLKAGDQIMGANNLVGLDDETVPDPMTVDFSRPAPIVHAAFGNGPHRCPGNILARREIRVFIEEWLPRIPEFSIKEGTTPDLYSGMNNGVREMWLTWPT